jgi:hypothetical protein
MNAPDTGFALMQLPSVLNSAYQSSPFVTDAEKEIQNLRKTLPFILPNQYRGIGRYPFNADYDYALPGWQWSGNKAQKDQDRKARARLREILGIKDDDLPQDVWLINGPWLLPELSHAREILDLLSSPEKFEIVEAARLPSRIKGASLGFDVGYWASGNFSLICDCAIWPLWHPPVIDALPELARKVAGLNEHLLFPSSQFAQDYLDWYAQQDWAEKPSEEFHIIAVASVDVP